MDIIQFLNLSLAVGIGWCCGRIIFDFTQPIYERVIAIMTLILWVCLCMGDNLKGY